MSSKRNSLPSEEQSLRRSSQSSKKKSSRGMNRFLKGLLGVFTVVVIGAGIYLGYMFATLEQVIDETGIPDKVSPEQSAKVKPITMLLLGTDYRPETGTHLTDVIMVASMNPETKSSTVVSLPRDTLLQMDGYKANKINAFYPNFLVKEKNSDISAKQEMKTMMSKFFDINIDYVVVMNFQGFRDIVDALGGVDVNVDANMCYRDRADGTNINLQKGAQHLDGVKALDYVRYRKSNCKPKTKASNDFERNQRQNEVLHALLDQAKSLNGVLGAADVIKSVGKNLETDLESEQMKNLMTTYWNISKENVDFMPITGDWKSPYVYLNKVEFEKAKEALNNELAGTKMSSLNTEASNSDHN